MLQITPKHKLHFAIKAIDFRRGIDGLIALCQQQLQEDPFNGNLFIFRNSRSTGVKILVYENNGFWLCYKRFSQGKLKWWPTDDKAATNVRAIELLIMLQQGEPAETKVPLGWR
jgi:transposase